MEHNTRGSITLPTYSTATSNSLHLVYTMLFPVKMASRVKWNSALYFCDGAQLTQTFCMHVFTEGYI